MVNLQINASKLSEETELAKSIIEDKLVVDKKFFHNLSGVYKTTNENLNNHTYVSSIKGRKKVLSITASGDQIINSILYGGEQITGIDISIFAKYFVALKIAAVETLTKEEYLRYILGVTGYPPLSKKLYEKIRESLDTESRFFWDEIFGNYTEKQIDASPFFRNFTSPKISFKVNNPYLLGSNYDTVKEKIEQANISFLDSDIFNLDNSSLGTFDLILLSNVLDYIYRFLGKEIDIIQEYKSFFEKLPLNKDGIAVAYNLTLASFLYTDLNEGNFSVHKVNGDFAGYMKNELIVYKNKRKVLESMKK